MSHPARALVALLLVSTALAGCFGAVEVPAQRTFSAAGGAVSPGWAYDGAGLAAVGATLEGTLDNAANTGSVTVAFDHAGSSWTVTFDRFAQADGKDFMDGGIAFEIAEHGDSGVADASIPKIHAVAAAWGQATVTRDGLPVIGAAGDLWAAHLMVSADTVRGPDGKIAKADGATPYDPATPADARRIEGDPQVLFWIKSPDGDAAKRAPAPVGATLSCAGPDCSQATEIAVEQGARQLTMNVTFRPSSTPVAAASEVVLVVTDAAGTEIGRASAGSLVGPEPVVSTIEADLTAPGVTGPFTATLTGDGVFDAVLEGTVAYDDHPFLVLTWDEVTIG